MLPTALLMELYDQQITRDEFERMLTIPDVKDVMKSLYDPCPRPVKKSLTIDAKKSSTLSNNEDSASSISTLSSSPTNTSVSYWRDLEVYSSSSSSDEEQSLRSLSSLDQHNNYNYNNSTFSYKPKPTSQTKANGKPKSYEIKKYCSFCFHNRENESVYTSHAIRDEANNITCPSLFEVVCRYCGATGTQAHTPKYCPHKSFGQHGYFKY